MSTWEEFQSDAPSLASEGQRLMNRGAGNSVLLATVRDAEPPRIHPIDAAIVAGRLYAFILGTSPKANDLESDGRYALHTLVDPAAPSEFSVRGRARGVDDGDVRHTVAEGWSFTVDEGYHLYELDIGAALLGKRAADEWPPRYSSWKASQPQ
ncbi:MAG: pyridoxamine 5'-phosphate oxidase family protein [Acidimicrobiia bacterium]|nr:pyridoxamine 5'-phosphate oxidase family protein [Acidimicrobiia bacterium]